MQFKDQLEKSITRSTLLENAHGGQGAWPSYKNAKRQCSNYLVSSSCTTLNNKYIIIMKIFFVQLGLETLYKCKNYMYLSFEVHIGCVMVLFSLKIKEGNYLALISTFTYFIYVQCVWFMHGKCVFGYGNILI